MEKSNPTGNNNPLKTSATIVAKEMFNSWWAWPDAKVRDLSDMIVVEALAHNLSWTKAIREHLGLWKTQTEDWSL